MASSELARVDKRQQELLAQLPVACRTEVLGEVPLTLEAKRRQVDDITKRLDAVIKKLDRKATGSG